MTWALTVAEAMRASTLRGRGYPEQDICDLLTARRFARKASLGGLPVRVSLPILRRSRLYQMSNAASQNMGHSV